MPGDRRGRAGERFDAEEFDVATIFFSRFENVVTPVPDRCRSSRLLRCRPRTTGKRTRTASTTTSPTRQAILADLLPRGVATQIFSALLENAASEQGARMSAMDNATRNAGEMIDKLTIEYNRTRQAVITNELIEIISGAEAL